MIRVLRILWFLLRPAPVPPPSTTTLVDTPIGVLHVTTSHA